MPARLQDKTGPASTGLKMRKDSPALSWDLSCIRVHNTPYAQQIKIKLQKGEGYTHTFVGSSLF